MTKVPTLEVTELEAHRDQIACDVKKLVEKYRAIFDWDIPDIDQGAADRPILGQLQRSIDDMKREFDSRSK